MAQLVEQRTRNAQVSSSNLDIGSRDITGVLGESPRIPFCMKVGVEP